MEIKPTKYYLEHTKFFRKPELKEYITFGTEGFTYLGNKIALALKRSADSNYVITIIGYGEIVSIMEHNIPDATKKAEQYVRKDLRI